MTEWLGHIIVGLIEAVQIKCLAAQMHGASIADKACHDSKMTIIAQQLFCFASLL